MVEAEQPMGGQDAWAARNIITESGQPGEGLR
jgi:hypothetical protein